jgi:hypothetical protein
MITTIYPTGDASLDTATIQAAHDDAYDGDILLLKAVNVSAVPTAWQLGTPSGNTLSSIVLDYPIAVPEGAFNLFADSWINCGFHGVGFKQVVLSKNITLRGEMDNNRQPITVIKWLGDGYTADQIFDPIGDGSCEGVEFITHSSKVKFENISFRNFFIAIENFYPVDVVNCDFTHCIAGLQSFYDYRSVFPRADAYGDYDTVVKTLLHRSTFNDCHQYWHAWGLSGLEVDGCRFGVPGLLWESNDPNPIMIYNETASTDYESLFGPVILTEKVIHNEIKNSTFIGTGNVTAPSAVIFLWGQEGYSCEMRDFNVTHCVFLDWIDLGSGCIIVSTRNNSITEDISIMSNHFINTLKPLTCNAPGNTPGNHCFINANFSDNTVANSWKNSDPGFYGAAARLLAHTSCCSVLNNDFTYSGCSNIDADPSGQACVQLASSCTNAVVSQNKYPPGQGGEANHVLDLGISNILIEKLG